MGTINTTATAMPHAHGAAAPAGGPHAAHGAHLEPAAPRTGDPRFIDGSTGEFGQSRKVAQKDGPAYGGREVAKNQNDNDRNQNDYGETDANFTRTLGLVADPDTGRPMSYAQTMQAYNAAGAVETLFPEVYAQLVANQNAGRGTVLGGALALLGITSSDGFGGASLSGIDPRIQGQVRAAQLPGLGSLADYVLDTRDFKGREWNRAHHPGSHWKGLTDLAAKGWTLDEAALLTGDSMTSWSGRVLGSNNQDGNKTGFADDELAGLKYLVLTEQATGRPALESVLGAHADTHLPEDKLTNPKINKLIGLPEGYRPKTPEEIAMVAGRIRQWASQPGVAVNQGEFNKFVEAGNKTAAGRQLAASGLLQTVQFEPEQQNDGGGGGGGNDAPKAEVTPTGLGTGQLDTAAAVGGGPILSATNPGSLTIATRPTLARLGEGGPFPVIDPGTGKLDKRLQDQLMTAFVDMLYEIHDNPILGDEEEREAFVDGATKGATFLKDAVAVDPGKVAGLKEELAAALADGNLTDAERTSLADKLEQAGMDDVAAAVKDGTASDKEVAALQEKVDGAASAKLEKDLTVALEDGKLTPEERAKVEDRLGKEGLDRLEAGIKDGTVTKEELTAISEGVAADAKAANAKPAATEDAKSGAAAADGKPAAGAAAKDDATRAAASAAPSGDAKPGTDAEPTGDVKAAADGKTAGDQKATTGSEQTGDPKAAPDAKPAAETKARDAEKPSGESNPAAAAAAPASASKAA